MIFFPATWLCVHPQQTCIFLPGIPEYATPASATRAVPQRCITSISLSHAVVRAFGASVNL
jgi:hypothetical protein